MKLLGIIGGLAPESTLEYYRLIVDAYRRKIQDGSYPHFLLNSVNLQKMVDLFSAGNLAGVAAYLSEEIDRLANAGAELGMIAANTPHLVFDEVRERSKIPLVSIVEAACAEVKSRGIFRAGLLGTRFTLQGKFYDKVFAERQIQIVVPDAQDIEYIHDKYLNELVKGVFLPETRERLSEIAHRMKEQQGIECLILGGTELPLILRGESLHGIPLLDTARIHVEYAIDAAAG